MAEFIFDVDKFRTDFPAFADPTEFPDETLQMNWDNAGCIVENTTYGCYALSGKCRERALYLLTAHLTALSVLIANGEIPGLEQSSTIDKITVSLTPPPLLTQFQWWLSLTPYGQQLLVILQVASVGGFYVGGLPETLGFRRIGGLFV